MHSMGDRVWFLTTWDDRDYIGGQLHRLGNMSHDVAVSVIRLDIRGSQFLSEIFEGYRKIVKSMEDLRTSSNNETISIAEYAKLANYRTQFLDGAERGLMVLQEKAENSLDKTY